MIDCFFIFSAVRKLSAKSFSVDKLIESIKTGRYKRIVVLAGAGISTPSGIPDFRFVYYISNRIDR